MTVFLPSLGPSVTLCTETVLSLFDEIDIVAGRAAQHRRRRHQHRLLQRIDEQLDVDELVREQGLVVVGEAARSVTVPVLVVIWLLSA